MRGRYAPSFFHLPAGEKMECASPPVLAMLKEEERY